MKPFLRQLAELARSERTRTKWIFLPYASLKWTLAERLLHEGQDWANFRFTTPFELALEAAAPELLARGLNPKPEGLGPSLVHKLLLELPPRTKPYFRDLVEQPGMAEVLWATLRECRMAGITYQQLSKVLREPKKSELTALLRAYEEYLTRQKIADRATIYQEARSTTVEPEDLVLELPSTLWAPLERQFLDGLAGIKIPAHAPDLPLPRRLAGAQRHPIATETADTSFFHAGRRDAEILEVLRRIRDLPLDQVEIASADPDSFELLRDKLAAYELPATFEPGLPVAASKPGQALLGLLTWIEHDYSAFDLRELLLSELLRPPELPAWSAGHLLARSAATWGRETYQLRLENLKSWLTQRARSQEEPDLEQGARITRLGRWIAGLLRRLPVDSENSADWATWVRGLMSILETDVPTPSPNDRAARQRLLRAMDELLLLQGERLSVEETVRWLRQKLEALSFGGSRALPGYIHVTHLDRVGLTGRPHTFLIAMEEGRLAGSQPEDAVLSDTERAALHPGLARSDDRSQERLFTVRERLAGLTGQVTYSFSARDLRTGGELLPSWLLFEAARAVRPLKDFHELREWLGEPAGYPHPQGAGEMEWWLARKGPVLARFPFLAAGIAARNERLSDRFTGYDGLVPSARELLDPRKTGEPISVSRLEGLAACPFRFFLERGLRLRPLDLERPDPDQWLDPAARGTLLHDLFATFYRELRLRGWTVVPDRDKPRLMSLLEAALLELRRSVPPPGEAVARQETRQLRRDLENFLSLEAGQGDRQPIGFEVAFGQEDTSDEPLARVEPVTLELGGWTLQVRGRIDRIDRLPDGLEVVDYKTGRKHKAPRGAIFQGGRVLQHAVYALVVEILSGEKVRGSSYYFPAAHSQQGRVELPYPSKTALTALLNDILEPLTSGAFLHTEDPATDCLYCDYKSACRVNTRDASRAKLAQPENQMLDYRRRASQIP